LNCSKRHRGARGREGAWRQDLGRALERTSRVDGKISISRRKESSPKPNAGEKSKKMSSVSLPKKGKGKVYDAKRGGSKRMEGANHTHSG